MRRTADFAVAPLLLGLVIATVGCQSLDGRQRNRTGNRLFKEGQFPDAAAQYEKALGEVDSPIIHYNAGLAYSKIFKAGYDKPILLAKASEEPCKLIPNVKSVDAQVCVKEGDRHYLECDAKSPCMPGFECQKATFCALDAKTVSDMAAAHIQTWLKVQPSDDEIKAKVKAVLAEVSALQADMAKPDTSKTEIANDDDKIKDLEKEVDDLHNKDKTRGVMTQMWLDSDQYAKALGYWTDLLNAKPNDPDIMGVLAGINLKAGDWRKSIEWYLKVADAASDPGAKVAAYQFIGNVAWSKLNSKSMTAAESIELADRGIAALQKAAALQPENPRPVGLMASIFNFRGNQQGASWAGGIERATAQDLQKSARVLNEKAKKAAEGAAPAQPAPAAATPTPSPAKTGG